MSCVGGEGDYANQTPALAVVLALIGDLIDKMQVENTTAFKIDRGFESKIGLGYRPVPQIEAPKRQLRWGSDLGRTEHGKGNRGGEMSADFCDWFPHDQMYFIHQIRCIEHETRLENGKAQSMILFLQNT